MSCDFDFETWYVNSNRHLWWHQTSFAGKSIFSIFIYQFLIIWICFNILHEIFTGFKRTRDKWLLRLIHFPLALFAEGAFLFKNPSGGFIYYCFLHIILQDMITLLIRCSWFRLWHKRSLEMSMKAAKHLVTSIIWHICGLFVDNVFIDWGVIVFNLLASLRVVIILSHFSLFRDIHFGGTTVFVAELWRGVRNVLWSMQANSSPDMITVTYDY